MTTVIIIGDIGGQIQVDGMDPLIAAAATKMQARLVSMANKDVTGWVEFFDSALGNDWANNDVVAVFSAENLSNAKDCKGYRLHIEVTTPTFVYGFTSPEVISVDSPT